MVICHLGGMEMKKNKIESFEDLDVYRLAEELSDRIWDIVSNWPNFPQNTLGYQLVKSADSIGANTCPVK